MHSFDFENVVRKQQSKSQQDLPQRKDSVTNANIIQSYFELNQSLQLSEILSQKSITGSKTSHEVLQYNINIENSEQENLSHQKQIDFQIQKKKSSSISQLHSKDSSKPDQQNTYKQKLENTAEQYRMMDEHRVPINELLERLQSDLIKGLDNSIAIVRNREVGDNKLTEKERIPNWVKFLKELANWFSIMLWVGAILCIIAYFLQDSDPSNLYLGIILVFVILLTGTITYQQTAKSEALMKKFKNFLPQTCTIIRDGSEQVILAEKLVPGDIVLVKIGDKIPADMRIVQSAEMKVDNSCLTGEVDALLRKVECTHPLNPLETANMAFFGTLCKEGRGKGIVVSIGDNTVLGQIADLAASNTKVKTPLRKELDRFVYLISIIAIILGIVFFILGKWVVGYKTMDCLIFGIGILVANVPEGLLGCITISLTITAGRLAKKSVLVKNLESVETLGSTSCICSDKTGTLTQNKMTVEHLWYDGKLHKALNMQKYGPMVNYEYDVDNPTFKKLKDCAVVSSEAKFDISLEEQEKNQQEGTTQDYNISWLDSKTIGDASESGLIKFYQPIQDIAVTRGRYALVQLLDGSSAKVPFNSTNKYALSIVHNDSDDYAYTIFIKGAPEKIWQFCSSILVEGRVKQIDENWKEQFNIINKDLGKRGERVLGFAQLQLNRQQYPKGMVFDVSNPENFNFPLQHYTFLGLISLIDPPKDTVPYAVLKCRSAGIKIIMVTGDQPTTATAIARQVNIIPKNVRTADEILEENPNLGWEEAAQRAQALVIHGDRINKAVEEQAMNGVPEDEYDITLREWAMKPYLVFARTTPVQKLMIVKACQKLGYIVGVTGDGVNDSPAIKQGDIGISMGISGSDVTKDAADMILLNDDFASIIDGIEEGRKIFDNLKKTIVYLLTSNITEVFPFLAFILFTIPLPLSSIFMLVICIGTDILPAISLAYEDAEMDIMTRRPRTKTQHMITAKLIMHAYGQMGIIASTAGFFAYYTVMYFYGFTTEGLFGMAKMPTFVKPNYVNDGDIKVYEPFNISSPNLGNSNLIYGVECNDSTNYEKQFELTSQSEVLDWVGIQDMSLDLRMQFVEYNCTTLRWQTLNLFRDCQSQKDSFQLSLQENVKNSNLSISPVSNTLVCYTTESLKYAQTAYFVAVVFIQWSNIFACKSKKQSLIHSSFNSVMIYGIICETAICVFLCYTPLVNKIFGARPLEFLQFGGPGFVFSMMLLFWDETRKLLIRKMPKKVGEKVSWWEDNLHW